MHEVFISYSNLNKSIADNICHELESNGVRCWYAPRDIVPGRDWREAILEAIENSKIFILIYTKESNQSRQVLNEVSAAFDASCTIIPFRIDNVEMSTALSYYLNSVHWLDATCASEKKKIDEAVVFVKKILCADESKEDTMQPNKKTEKKNRRLRPVILVSLIVVLVISAIILTIGFASDWGSKENGFFSQLFEKNISILEDPEAIENVKKSVVNLNVSLNDIMVTSTTGVACIKDNIIVTTASVFSEDHLETLGEYMGIENITAEDLEIHIISDDGLCIKISDILFLDNDTNIAVLSTSATHNIPLLPLSDTTDLKEGSKMLMISYVPEFETSLACECSYINSSLKPNGIEYLTVNGTTDYIYGGGALVDSSGKLCGICTSSLVDSPTYFAVPIDEITSRLNSQ